MKKDYFHKPTLLDYLLLLVLFSYFGTISYAETVELQNELNGINIRVKFESASVVIPFNCTARIDNYYRSYNDNYGENRGLAMLSCDNVLFNKGDLVEFEIEISAPSNNYTIAINYGSQALSAERVGTSNVWRGAFQPQLNSKNPNQTQMCSEFPIPANHFRTLANLFRVHIASGVARDNIHQMAISTATKALIPIQKLGTAISPQIPWLILHDPPGDGSYSFFEQNKKVCRAFTLKHEVAGEAGGYVSAKLGAKGEISAGFIVEVSTEFEAYVEATASASFGASKTGANTYESCIDFSSRFQTSAYDPVTHPQITGNQGDVFIGLGTTYTYGLYQRYFDPGGCFGGFVIEEDVIFSPVSFTQFMYTEDAIQEDIAIQQGIANNTNLNYKDRAKAQAQANVWSRVLEMNQQNIQNAISVPELLNKTFVAGPTGDEQWTTEVSQLTEIDTEFFFETQVQVDAKVEVAGSGVGGGFYAKARLGFGTTNASSSNLSDVIGYHIEDDDVEGERDIITVNVKKDPMYGTPVFELLPNASQTSCPYEGGLRRYVPQLTFSDGSKNKRLIGIPRNQEGEFQIEICNLSESGEDLDYFLDLIAGNVAVGNAEITYSSTNLVNANENGNATLSDLTHGSTNCLEDVINVGLDNVNGSQVFFENVPIVLADKCNDQVSDQILLTALFGDKHPDAAANDVPCDAVSIPVNGVVQNGFTNVDATGLTYDTPNDHSRNEQQLTPPSGSANCATSWCEDHSIGIGFNQINNSVWFKFIAPANGLVQISTVHPGTSFDTQIAVYEVSNCADFTTYTLLAANDDAPVTGEVYEVKSLLDVSGLTAGRTYYILVDGYHLKSIGPRSGTLSISITNNDLDGDGVVNAQDRCPEGNDALDAEQDGIPDACDVCPNKANAALDFDGVDDYVEVGNDLGNFGEANFTIEGWIKTTRSGVLLSKRPFCGCSNFWNLLILENGTLEWENYEEECTNVVVRSELGNTVINDGEWHHIAVRRSGSTLSFFIDGVLDISHRNISSIDINNDAPFQIGNSVCVGQNTTLKFKGQLDELRIWSVARTITQLRDHKDSELQGTETGLEAYYNFSEGTPVQNNAATTMIVDQTSNNYLGTLQNFSNTGATSNWVLEPVVLCGAAENCTETNIVLGTNDATESTYSAIKTLTSRAVLNADKSVLYTAGETITLTAGFHAVKNSNFTAKIQDCTPLSKTHSPISETLPLTEVSSTSNAAGLSIFPNPATDKTSIHFSLSESGVILLEIFDITGKPVYQIINNAYLEKGAYKEELNMSNLIGGMYLILLKTEEGVSSKKLMKLE